MKCIVKESKARTLRVNICLRRCFTDKIFLNVQSKFYFIRITMKIFLRAFKKDSERKFKV